jgi:hypothetical protein
MSTDHHGGNAELTQFSIHQNLENPSPHRILSLT